MSKVLKAFIIRDDFVTPKNHEVSPIYELSEISETFSRVKEIVYPDQFPTYTIWSFGYKDENALTQVEANTIVKVVKEFVSALTLDPTALPVSIIPNFISNFNLLNPDTPVLDLDYNRVVGHGGISVPDYISFKVLDVDCSIWLAEETFNMFYPDYDIEVILPFENFTTIIHSLQQTLNELDGFDPVKLNDRIELNKGGYPPTYTRILNIPFQIPNSRSTRPCYFGFNIHGRHGNYDHVLKQYLYDYLVNDLGLGSTFVEDRFPSILEVNEFFIVPRWDRTAISANLGQIAIGSHISKAHNVTPDMDKYVRVIDDEVFVRDNTYNVPSTYNNILLSTLNGLHTEPELQNFPDYYHDLLTVNSLHPDYSRMRGRTQRFITLMENMLKTSDVTSQSELFSKVMANQDYSFNIITRKGVLYLSTYFEDHQYYVIPKYEYLDKS